MRATDENAAASNLRRLAGLRGYHVDSRGGRLGVVEELRGDPERGEAQAIVVRAGMLGTHRLMIHSEQIAAVVPSRRRVVLHAHWSPDLDRPLTRWDDPALWP